MLTGGGTAGHVTANIALLPALAEAGYEVYYIGGAKGIERELTAPLGIKYYGISAGKLRRRPSFKNLCKNIADIFNVMKGYRQSKKIIGEIMPDVIFSKGGFVSVPVVLAAKKKRIPIIIHESDLTPGLANRIAFKYASRICVTFPETLGHVPKNKGVYTGTPIRPELFQGSKDTAVKICGFDANDNRPTVLVTGGSQGSAAVNSCVRQALPELLKKYKVIHLCGKGNTVYLSMPGYFQLEYASDEMPHLLALSELVVSRAGANTICELLELRKPHLLIPLTKKGSRGDQLENAASFEKQGFSMVLPEEKINKLPECLDILCANREGYIKKMEESADDGGCSGLRRTLETINGLIGL